MPVACIVWKFSLHGRDELLILSGSLKAWGTCKGLRSLPLVVPFEFAGILR